MFNKLNFNCHYLHLGTIFYDCIKDKIIFIIFLCTKYLQSTHIYKLYTVCIVNSLPRVFHILLNTRTK